MSPRPDRYINRKELAPGITVHVLSVSNELMQCWVAMTAGTELPIHSHPHAQASYVISGHVRWTIDGTEVDGPAASSVIFAPGQRHGAAVLTDCEIVDTFTPPRLEYLS